MSQTLVTERVPDAVAPPPHHRRFPLIDGVRALAALSVLAVHAAVFGGAIGSSPAGRLLAHLNVGVTIFFVVSGFLLYRPFIAHRRPEGGAPPPAVPEYARRRFLRIFPAYWVVLTVLVLVPGLTGIVGGEVVQQYALVQTLPFAHGAGCTGAIFECGLAQTWSLVVELTFYAALPLYVVLAARLTRSLATARWVVAELALLTALSGASLLLHFAILDAGPRSIAGGSVVGYVFWFALGMGLAVVSVGLESRSLGSRIGSRMALAWPAAGALYVLISLWLPATPFVLDRVQQLVTHVVFGVIAALVVAPAIFDRAHARGLPRRLLGHPRVAWLGLISYGIFLWHYVIALELGPRGLQAGFAVVLPGTLVLSIACGAASYHLVERPLLRLKHGRPARAERAGRR